MAVLTLNELSDNNKCFIL